MNDIFNKPDYIKEEIVTSNIPNLGKAKYGKITKIHLDVDYQIYNTSPIVSMETEFEKFDVDTSHAGISRKIHVSVGDVVSEGDALVTIKTQSKKSLLIEQLEENLWTQSA